MDKWLTITKLNLIPKETNNLAMNFLSSLGVDTSGVLEEEVVVINTDRIIGISQKMKTGIKDDDRLCCKVYFNSKDYWAVKYDDYLENLLNFYFEIND